MKDASVSAACVLKLEKTVGKALGHFTCKEQHLPTHGILVTLPSALIESVKQLKGYVLAHGLRLLGGGVLQLELKTAGYIVLSQEAAPVSFHCLVVRMCLPYSINLIWIILQRHIQRLASLMILDPVKLTTSC